MLSLLMGLSIWAFPSPVLSAELLVPQPTQSLPRLLTYEQVQTLVYDSAERVGLNKALREEMLDTILCEAPTAKIDGVVLYDSEGQSNHKYKSGGREESWGLSQIHLPAHPDITKEQATDAQWALDWTAKEFSKGRASQWTCWVDSSTTSKK